jgi:TonB family protein
VSTENDLPTPSSQRAEPPTPSPSAAGEDSRELLSTDTSLEDLFTALLGADARQTDERGPLVETVEAQVRGLREELGLVEPPPPAPRRLPEFVPVYRTQHPEELTFSSAQGAQWTVSRTRRSGLLDFSAMPRVVLVAVPAAAVLFIAGIYWGTTSGSALPPPASPALLAAPQQQAMAAPVVASDTEVVLRDAPASVDAPAAEAPAVVAVADTTRSIPSPAPADLAAPPPTSRAPVAPQRADPPRLTPAAAPVAAPAVARSNDRPSVPPAPVGTTGTNAPAQAAPTPVAAATPAPAVVAAPAPAAPSPREAAPAVAQPVQVPPPVAAAAPTPAAASIPAPPAVGAPPAVSAPPALVAPVAATSAPAPPPAAAPVAAAAAARVNREAVLVTRVPPVYPELARRLGTTGDVDLDIEIDASGRVVRASSISGPRALRDAAESAVLQWRYQPQVSESVAVASRRRVRVSFR